MGMNIQVCEMSLLSEDARQSYCFVPEWRPRQLPRLTVHGQVEGDRVPYKDTGMVQEEIAEKAKETNRPSRGNLTALMEPCGALPRKCLFMYSFSEKRLVIFPTRRDRVIGPIYDEIPRGQ
jgi:hypothetical protein